MPDKETSAEPTGAPQGWFRAGDPKTQSCLTPQGTAAAQTDVAKAAPADAAENEQEI